MLTAEDMAKIQALPDGPMKAQMLQYAQATGAPMPAAPGDAAAFGALAPKAFNPAPVPDIAPQMIPAAMGMPPNQAAMLNPGGAAEKALGAQTAAAKFDPGVGPIGKSQVAGALVVHGADEPPVMVNKDITPQSFGGGPKPAPFTGGGVPAGPAPDKGAEDYYTGKAFTPQMQKLQNEQIAITGKTSEAQVAASEAYAAATHSKSNLLRNAQEDAENMAAEQEAREKERQTYMAHAMDLYEKSAAEMAAKTVDPDHYWTSKSTGGKIGTIIGLALASIGGAGTNGINVAAKDFQAQIDRDIDLQKGSIAQGYKALEGKRTMMGDRMKLFGDERMAELSTRAEFWKSIEMKSAAIGSTYEGEAAAAKTQEIVAYAQMQQNQLKQGFEARAEDIIARKEAAAAAASNAAAAAKAKRNDEVFKADLAAKQEWLKDAQIPGASITLGANGMPQVVAPVIDAQGNITGYQHITPQGKPGADKAIPVSIVTGINAEGKPLYTQSHATPARAKELDEASRTFVDLKRDIGIVREELTNHPHGALPLISTDARARADAAVGRARLAMAHLAHLGALSESDYKQIEAQLPANPLNVWANTGAARVKVDEFEKSLDAKYKASVETNIPGSIPKALPTVAAPAPSE